MRARLVGREVVDALRARFRELVRRRLVGRFATWVELLPLLVSLAVGLLLDLHGLFKKYYDGWEATMNYSSEILSYRYYYYHIPHDDLSQMIKFLYTRGKNHKYVIKIGSQNEGNYNFPEPNHTA